MVDFIQDNTDIPADPQEERVPQTSIKVVAARSKAKAKPQQREPVDTTAIIPMHERKWIDIEPSEQTLAAYDLSKKVISLLRHNQTVQRETDGAIEFYRIKFYLRNHSSQVQHWSVDMHSAWKRHQDAVFWVDIDLGIKEGLVFYQTYHYVKEDGLTLSHQSKISIRTISRRKSSIFFDTIRRYIEKKMEQFNSTK